MRKTIMFVGTAVILCGTLIGCMTLAERSAAFNAAQSEKIASMASFELDCPIESITTTILETDGYGDATRIGAKGCDETLVYVRVNVGEMEPARWATD